jgi:hypothetical protein
MTDLGILDNAIFQIILYKVYIFLFFIMNYNIKYQKKLNFEKNRTSSCYVTRKNLNEDGKYLERSDNDL